MAALSEIEKLEARWAENPDGRYFAPLADAYRKAGRVDEAITVVMGGLARHPDYLSAHIVLGRCHLEKKDDGAARAAFDKVLSLDSENIIALKSLAEIAERTGAPDDARQWLQRLLVIDAMNTEAADDLARLGGPLAQEAAPEEVAAPAEDDARISFADISTPEAPPEPQPEPEPEPEPAYQPPVSQSQEITTAVPAISHIEVPKTIERLAVTPDMLRLASNETMDIMPAVPPPEPVTEPVPALDLEPTSFTPPPPEEAPAAAPGEFVPFDDQLQWGAGERQSQAIRSEDIAEAEAHHEETASAIDFVAPAAEDVPASAPEPEPEPMMLDAAPAGPHSPSGDLMLIMPEDVTPAEELRRPSSKQVQMVSPEPEGAAEQGAEPIVTETMGDLWLRQGHREQAAEVYRQLLKSRPGDAGLQAKLSAIASPPAFSASAMGTEAVGPWLRRIAQAQLPSGAPAPAPQPEPGPTPMEQAFSAPEPEPEPAPAQPEAAAAAAPVAEGSPARPAADAFSLDQIFGGGGGSAAGSTPASPSAPDPAPAASTPLGASFDEFFGSAPKKESARPSKEISGGAARPSEDDLSAFNAWLHGLKR